MTITSSTAEVVDAVEFGLDLEPDTAIPAQRELRNEYSLEKAALQRQRIQRLAFGVSIACVSIAAVLYQLQGR